MKQKLEGHSHAVSLLALPNDIIITGSQDKMLRFWFKGMLQKEIPNAHEDIIRGIVEIPGVGFATCSNDQLVKIWTIDGQKLMTMTGHQGFVFGLCCLDSGEVVSGSDDCTVKVWKDGTCVQTLNHSRTIWAVTKNHLGDLITASED